MPGWRATASLGSLWGQSWSLGSVVSDQIKGFLWFFFEADFGRGKPDQGALAFGPVVSWTLAA